MLPFVQYIPVGVALGGRNLFLMQNLISELFQNIVSRSYLHVTFSRSLRFGKSSICVEGGNNKSAAL